MRRRRRFFDSCNPFEQENQWDAAECKQAEHIKIIHERPQMSLLIEQSTLASIATALPGNIGEEMEEITL